MTELVVAEVLAGARDAQQTEEPRSTQLGLTLLPLNGQDAFERAATPARHTPLEVVNVG